MVIQLALTSALPPKVLGIYLSFGFPSVLPCSQLERQSPLFSRFSSFCFLPITRSGHIAEIRWSICIAKSKRSLCVSFSITYSRLHLYHSVEWSNSNFLHNFQWITIPTQSCLVSYSFCTNLLHSFIIWLIDWLLLLSLYSFESFSPQH